MQPFSRLFSFTSEFANRHFLETATVSKSFGKPLDEKAVNFEFEVFYFFQILYVMDINKATINCKSETQISLYCYFVEGLESKYGSDLFSETKMVDVITDRMEKYLELVSGSSNSFSKDLIERFAFNVTGATSNGNILTRYPIVIEALIDGYGKTTLLKNILIENSQKNCLLFQSCIQSLSQAKKEFSTLSEEEANELLGGGYTIFCSAMEGQTDISCVPAFISSPQTLRSSYFTAGISLLIVLYWAF